MSSSGSTDTSALHEQYGAYVQLSMLIILFVMNPNIFAGSL